jgi:hypothetical protein
MLANASEIRSLDNYRKLSMNFLQELGRRVTMLPKAEKDKEHNAEMVRIGKALKEEEIERVMAAPKVSDEAYEKLMVLDMRTEQQLAMVQSYELREFLCGEVCQEHIEFYLRGRMKAVKNMEAATSSEADVKAFDEAEEKEGVSRIARFRAELRREVFLFACQRLGVDPRDGFQGEFRSDAAEQFLKWAISEASTLNQLFGGIIDPKRPPKGAVQFLQKFFAQYGIRLGKRKSNGNIIRFVDMESVDMVLGFVQRRRARGRELIEQHRPDDSPLCATPP